MVPKASKARKQRNPAAGAKPEAALDRFSGAFGDDFSCFQKLVTRPEGLYSESAGFFLPAADP
jgi:hypothetical protein